MGTGLVVSAGWLAGCAYHVYISNMYHLFPYVKDLFSAVTAAAAAAAGAVWIWCGIGIGIDDGGVDGDHERDEQMHMIMCEFVCVCGLCTHFDNGCE